MNDDHSAPLFEGEFHWLVKRLLDNEDDVLERTIPYVRVRLAEVSDEGEAEAEFNRLCRQALLLLHADQRMDHDLKAAVDAWGDMDRWWCIAELREWIAAHEEGRPYRSGFQDLECVQVDDERTL